MTSYKTILPINQQTSQVKDQPVLIHLDNFYIIFKLIQFHILSGFENIKVN